MQVRKKVLVESWWGTCLWGQASVVTAEILRLTRAQDPLVKPDVPVGKDA